MFSKKRTFGQLFAFLNSTDSPLYNQQPPIFQLITFLFSLKKFSKTENFFSFPYRKVSRFGKLFSNAKI